MAAEPAIDYGDGGPAGSELDMTAGALGAAMDQAGHALHRRPPALPMDFRFSWRDMPIDVVVDESADEAEVRLRLTLGKLPFTAENADLRAQVRYLQIRRQELPLGAVEVDGEQTMHFVACVPLAGPSSVGFPAGRRPDPGRSCRDRGSGRRWHDRSP